MDLVRKVHDIMLWALDWLEKRKAGAALYLYRNTAREQQPLGKGLDPFYLLAFQRVYL